MIRYELANIAGGLLYRYLSIVHWHPIWYSQRLRRNLDNGQMQKRIQFMVLVSHRKRNCWR